MAGDFAVVKMHLHRVLCVLLLALGYAAGAGEPFCPTDWHRWTAADAGSRASIVLKYAPASALGLAATV